MKKEEVKYMQKIYKFIRRCLALYIVLFFIIFLPFGAFPGTDIVGGSFTYFGFVILSAVLLYIHEDSKTK